MRRGGDADAQALALAQDGCMPKVGHPPLAPEGAIDLKNAQVASGALLVTTALSAGLRFVVHQELALIKANG